MKEEMERQKGFEEPGQYYNTLSKKKVKDTKRKIKRKIDNISKKKKPAGLCMPKKNHKKGAPLKIFNNKRSVVPFRWDIVST